MEWIKNDFLITDDLRKVDLDITHQLLRETYWGHHRSRDVVNKMIRYSLCFSLLHENEQMDSAGIACHKLGSKIIPSNATSCGQTKFWVGGDYTPINEYI